MLFPSLLARFGSIDVLYFDDDSFPNYSIDRSISPSIADKLICRAYIDPAASFFVAEPRGKFLT